MKILPPQYSLSLFFFSGNFFFSTKRIFFFLVRSVSSSLFSEFLDLVSQFLDLPSLAYSSLPTRTLPAPNHSLSLSLYRCYLCFDSHTHTTNTHQSPIHSSLKNALPSSIFHHFPRNVSQIFPRKIEQNGRA